MDALGLCNFRCTDARSELSRGADLDAEVQQDLGELPSVLGPAAGHWPPTAFDKARVSKAAQSQVSLLRRASGPASTGAPPA